eukprot:COSAG05_NODE_8591_length_690_cov_1.079526_1_plen_100_part_00
MAPHQKVLVVPGLFADPNVTRSGSILSQDQAVAVKLQGYADWIRTEPRIVGINEWHWTNDKDARGKWLSSYTDFAVGTVSLPKTTKLMAALASKRPGQN